MDENWKEEHGRVIHDILGLHEAIRTYLKLMKDPDRVSADDLSTVFKMTGCLSPAIGQDGLSEILPEFVVYHGFDPVPTEDGYYVRYPTKKRVH